MRDPVIGGLFKMTISKYLGLVAAGALASCLAACQPTGQSGASAAADPAKEEAAINAQIDAFNAAQKAKDADKVVATEVADVRGYGGGADTTSRDDDLKNTKAAMTDPAYAFAVKAEHTEIAKSGDIAFQSGTWEAAGTNPATKKVEHASGHWVAGWRKDTDGAWKVAAVSAAAPPTPAAAPAAGGDAEALAKAPKKK
jgi:ketosteroid isomerase-like protein